MSNQRQYLQYWTWPPVCYPDPAPGSLKNTDQRGRAIVGRRYACNTASANTTPTTFYPEPTRTFTRQWLGRPAQSDSGGHSSASSLSNHHQRRPSDVQTCNFCKGNGEERSVYESHTLRDDSGLLVCPVLRAYICPVCGSTGDSAHTISHCPWNKDTSVAKAIRLSRGHNSAGKAKK